eukprot:CAMPEP_0115689706 /NCGR_PEP_ID=MMETSP0272-20121206/61707_1 /TAXON_ID=71861 /ORGANISM="Scrippsiella trochoidea, Strain CCMP3099" /LENGTH=120 /DNA_ID=CAMNT_0003129519 /DNA_START=155 /DNA_END=514 /DNA_ORIENTATION=+
MSRRHRQVRLARQQRLYNDVSPCTWQQDLKKAMTDIFGGIDFHSIFDCGKGSSPRHLTNDGQRCCIECCFLTRQLQPLCGLPRGALEVAGAAGERCRNHLPTRTIARVFGVLLPARALDL